MVKVLAQIVKIGDLKTHLISVEELAELKQTKIDWTWKDYFRRAKNVHGYAAVVFETDEDEASLVHVKVDGQRVDGSYLFGSAEDFRENLPDLYVLFHLAFRTP